MTVGDRVVLVCYSEPIGGEVARIDRQPNGIYRYFVIQDTDPEDGLQWTGWYNRGEIEPERDWMLKTTCPICGEPGGNHRNCGRAQRMGVD